MFNIFFLLNFQGSVQKMESNKDQNNKKNSNNIYENNNFANINSIDSILIRYIQNLQASLDIQSNLNRNENNHNPYFRTISPMISPSGPLISILINYINSLKATINQQSVFTSNRTKLFKNNDPFSGYAQP